MRQVTKAILREYSKFSILKILNKATQLKDYLDSVDYSNPNTKLVKLRRGLCLNLDLDFHRTSILLDYPNWSGSYNYPVKGGQLSACAAYHNANNLYCGAYGKRRINLLNWIIKEFRIAYDIKIKETK